MDSNEIKGQWNQLKGNVRKQWGDLTDDDVAEIKGERDILIGKIQERYGIARDEAEKQVDSWRAG
ncbi:CsbD family protein [Minwuia sp.]|uniref:CsbD family protein n=1 Tax=Minwuia sp. TaxID=2493630 RepID=UPI003A948AA2